MMYRMLCVFVVVAAAACSDQKGGWVVAIQVQGSQAAFSGRQIVMTAKVAKTAPPPAGAGAGILATEVGFSTRNYDRFLSAPIDIAIREGDATITAVTLDRVACKFSSTPGYLERNYLFLEDAGDLLATIDGSDSRVYASCQTKGQPLVCTNDEL